MPLLVIRLSKDWFDLTNYTIWSQSKDTYLLHDHNVWLDWRYEVVNVVTNADDGTESTARDYKSDGIFYKTLRS